jgi:hypothetical protein
MLLKVATRGDGADKYSRSSFVPRQLLSTPCYDAKPRGRILIFQQ